MRFPAMPQGLGRSISRSCGNDLEKHEVRCSCLYGHISYVTEGSASHGPVCPIRGKTFQMWDDFPYVGKLPIYGKSPQIWEGEVFTDMGSLPMKASRIWEETA